MILRAAVLAFGLILSGPALAQPVFGSFHVFDTRFGQMQVVGGDVDQQLWFDGAFLPLPIRPRWEIMGAWGMAGAVEDWVLVAWHHGGNACAGALHMLRVGDGPVAASPEIGACDGRIIDLRVLPGGMEIDITDRALAISHRTYRWDGAQMTQTAHAASQVAPAGAGQDVTRWIGQHPYQPFEDPGEQARFATIMAPDEVTALFERIGPANMAVQRGDWVFGAGCQAHACNQAGGRWGMRISDGAVVAAILTRGQPARLFGTLARSPAFQSWLAETPL